MTPLEIVRGILNHPLNRRHKLRALVRFLAWQARSRLSRAKVSVPFAGDTRLLVSRGMTGATGNIYNGLNEFADMALVLHALRPGDLFLDVGANIGAYTVLAAGAAGARAVAFEPVPATFAHLRDNLRHNRLCDRVEALNVGVGRRRGTLRFTAGLDTTNHVIEASAAEGVEIPVVPLDDFVGRLAPTVLKVDVEGFEAEVIAGADRLLQSDSLLAVVLELNGSGSRYGFDESAVRDRMAALGFRLASYRPFERALRVAEARASDDASAAGEGNTLYVRDTDALQRRLAGAPKVRIHGTHL